MVRGTAEVVGSDARAGDAVLFLPASRRVVKLGYPEQFRSVDDVALVPNGDLQFVPEQIARQKIQRLGAAKTAQAKEAVA